MLDVLTILLLLAALFSFISERFLHMQTTIGLMFLSLLLVLGLSGIRGLGVDIWHFKTIRQLLSLDFSALVLQGMLCFLLFSGAVNLSLRALTQHKWEVIVLSLLGTILSTLVIACIVFGVLNFLGTYIPFIWALIFGAIVSPTDPVAALAILKNVGIPKNLEVVIDGESQFNDGIGVVLFVTFTSIAYKQSEPHLLAMATMFTKEVVGGIGLGIGMSALAHILIRRSNQVITMVLLTLAAVSSSYALAEVMGVSGPLTCVVLGLIVGKYTIRHDLSKKIQRDIHTFWELINQVLNSVLFILIGLEAMTIPFSDITDAKLVITAIVSVLLGRYISVLVALFLLQVDKCFNLALCRHLANLFTWAGLRGALAVALVLSLPASIYKDILLPMVYGVVLFSILIQGLTIKPLFGVKRLQKLAKAEAQTGR